MSEKSPNLWRSKICILSHEMQIIGRLRGYLTRSELFVEVGSISDQLEIEDILAVDNIWKSLSYEWPVKVTIFCVGKIEFSTKNEKKLNLVLSVNFSMWKYQTS